MVDAGTIISIIVTVIILGIVGLFVYRRIFQSRAYRKGVYPAGRKATPEGEPIGDPHYSGRRFPMRITRIAIAAIIGVIVLSVVLASSIKIVEAGHRGVVLYLGAVENRVLGEGVHLITPFAEQIIPMEVRTLKFQADASAASNDLQEVQTVIALNFHIDPGQTNIIYQQLGIDYADRIIAPTIQESVKASVAKFNAEELITKRETAKGVIADAIRKTLSDRNIIVETVFITDFKFSQAFAVQIESKVVAYQKFLTEQNNLKAIEVVANQTVVQAEAQARANVARANGEAEAIKVINEQLKSSPDYLQWQAINKWNGQMPYAVGSGAFPFFQLPLPPQPN